MHRLGPHGVWGLRPARPGRDSLDIEQWSHASGSNVIPRRACPGLAGLWPHTTLEQGACRAEEAFERPGEAARQREGSVTGVPRT